MPKIHKAIIIGGGIGGLSAAIALRRHGFDTEIYEKAPQLREAGSGFILSPNGVKAIYRLGEDITNAVYIHGNDTSTYTLPYLFLKSNGKIRFEHSFRHLKEKYGAPMITIHRQKFHQILQNALPAEMIHCDSRFIECYQDNQGVIAQFQNGIEVRADLLIGADGLYSTVRSKTFGEQASKHARMHAPQYLGCTSVRGVTKTPDHPFLRGRPGFQTTGAGMQFYSMCISQDSIYWTATPNAPEGEWPKLPNSIVKERLLERYANWHDPIKDMIKNADTDKLIVCDVYDRPPLSSWINNRITLLGDAAHPMSPFLGQGANMSIEDAVRLADYLSSNEDFSAALKQYEDERMPRTYRMVEYSRMLGAMGHLENPIASWLVDLATFVMMHLPGASKRSDWIFTYNP